MIYVLTFSKIAPGEPSGSISDLFENAFTDKMRAYREFDNMTLNTEFFRKELWLIEPGGKRSLLKEERYHDKGNSVA